MTKGCSNCRYYNISSLYQPCNNCEDKNNWEEEPKDENCDNCKERKIIYEVCHACNYYKSFDNIKDIKLDDKISAPSLDYKYEYNKILLEDKELKESIVLYKDIIENLAMLLNSK